MNRNNDAIIPFHSNDFNAATSPHTFNSLSQGSHTVIVKDNNGCTETKSVTINEPNAVTLSLGKTDVSCNGDNDGSITATFGGSTSPYQVKIDDGNFNAATSPHTFNSLSQGSHTVIVKDNNGCTETKSVTINEPAAVTLSLDKTDVSRNGDNDGSITATFGGGTSPYQIKIDDGNF